MIRQTDDAESIGLSAKGVERACGLLDEAVSRGDLMGAAVQISRRGVALSPACFGRRRLEVGGPPVEPDTIFLVASVTKPVVCTAVMLLVERGKICLDDRVVDLVPEFASHGKDEIRVRHLLTHTSGLPDMLDENLKLRAQKAPLKVFVERICQLKPLFKPGTRISYQSAGIAMLGEIVERLEGVRLRDFLRQEVFDPLGLGDTSLGMREDRQDRISQAKIPGGKFEFGASEADYNWNSDYWLNFGAPWGGMLTTVGDMTVLCQLFLNGGQVGDVRILSPSTVAAMTSDQTSSVLGFPGCDRFAQRWGLGWHLRGLNSDRFGGLDVTGPVHWFDSAFGDLTSDATYGHMGATGTVVWIDPEYDMSCVLFTNDPQGADPLRFRVSNAVAGSLTRI